MADCAQVYIVAYSSTLFNWDLVTAFVFSTLKDFFFFEQFKFSLLKFIYNMIPYIILVLTGEALWTINFADLHMDDRLSIWLKLA